MSTANKKFQVHRPAVDPKALEAFAEGANTAPGQKPWEGKDDKRRVNSYLMRFTDFEMAKLRHIAATSPESMQSFCQKAIRQALDSYNFK